jgi:hypothetical protein
MKNSVAIIGFCVLTGAGEAAGNRTRRRLRKLHMTPRHSAVNESHWPSPVVLARLPLTAAGQFRPTKDGEFR